MNRKPVTKYAYDDIKWTRATIAPVTRIALCEPPLSSAQNNSSKAPTPLPHIESHPNSITLRHPTYNGKISDSGYDQMTCIYTSLPSNTDFLLSASIKLCSFCSEEHYSRQEGFGVFVRDTISPDNQTGYPYSSMVAVGGYAGNFNIFGRYLDAEMNTYNISITDTDIEFPVISVDEGSTQDYMLEIIRRGNHLECSMKSLDGSSVLTQAEGDPHSVFNIQRSSDDAFSFDLPHDFLCARDPDKLYIGFFCTRGSKIIIDKSSVMLSIFHSSSHAEKRIAPFAPKDSIQKDQETLDFPQMAEARFAAQDSVIYSAPNAPVSASGTIDDPLDLQTAIDRCSPGQTVKLLPGRYCPNTSIEIRPENDGLPQSTKKLCSADNSSPAVLDFQNKPFGLTAGCSYWIIEGLAVLHGMGFQISGSHNLVKDCIARRNLETGILIRCPQGESPREQWPSYNTVENCISCENSDSTSQNADGFACKVAAGSGNRFVHCLSFFNADDGFDLFSKNHPIGAVYIEGCESHMNGFNAGADGVLEPTPGKSCGFKLGGCGLAIEHVLADCTATYNQAFGFSSNSNPCLNLIRCTAHSNPLGNKYYYHGCSGIEDNQHIEDCDFSDPQSTDVNDILARLHAQLAELPE